MCYFLFFAILVVVVIEVDGFANKKQVEYIIDLPHCKIPNVPLNNSAIRPEWEVPFDEPECPKEQELFTISENGELSLTEYATTTYSNCCYTEIQRPDKLESDNYQLSACHPLESGIGVNATSLEFFYVACHHEGDELRKAANQYPPGVELLLKLITTQHFFKFRSQIPIRGKALKKLTYWKSQSAEIEKPFSVMMLILDSVTRTHALRGLPQTMTYMKEEMNFIPFKGHHTMGGATFRNEVPMMTGSLYSDFEKDRKGFKGKYDQVPFIWRNFSDANYVTLDNEDCPDWHTFNFGGRTGFTQKPFDYYLRPYYLAQEKINGKGTVRKMRIGHVRKVKGKKVFESFNYSPLVCMEGKPVYRFLLDYTWEFLNVFNPSAVPSFSLSFIAWPQHDYLTSIRVLDSPLLQFLQNVKGSSSIYENTIIFLMGDHAFRWANYSFTPEGLLERDLPLLSIRVPERFQEKYPQLAQNLKENANKITSQVDIFKTLAHLHRIGLGKEGKSGHYGYEKGYGRSLFEEIPEERDCADAQVPPQYCACGYPLYSSLFDFTKFTYE